MKHILYILIISILFSSHTSYAMQQSLSNRQIYMFMCVAVGCGVSLCLAYKYKDLIMSYLSYWNDEKKSDVVNLKNQYQQNQKHDQEEDNIFTPDDIDKLLTKRKQEEKIPNKDTSELHRACLDNNVKMVKELLKNKDVDINKKYTIQVEEYFNFNRQKYFVNQEETPLLIAFRLKNKEIINVLLEHKDVDVSIENNYGVTPLSYACCRNDINMVKRLLNHSTIKLDNSQSLYIACVNGNIDIVTLLLQYNKDNCMKINNALLGVCQQIGKCAMKCNACDIIINALSKNITLQDLFNWEIFDNYPYCGILELLQKKRNPKNEAYQEKQKYIDEREKFIHIINLLLQQQFIDLNQIDDEKKSIFHYAAADNELLQLLLEKNKSLPNEKKCSIDAYSRYDTPLHEAVNNSNIKSVQLLVENGADLSKKCKNRGCCYTPFSLACSKFSDKNSLEIYKEIIKYFLTLKQLIEDKDQLSEGLYILVRKKNNDFIEEFLSYGADPNRKNSDGNSPLLTVAWKDLFLLNLFIDKYKGDINQQGNDQNTIFYTVYMAKIIQKPDDINYIKQLDNDAKKKFMEQELIIVAQKSPEQIFLCYGCPTDKTYINEYIEKLNNFVATCISYGDIQIDTIQTNDGTLLDIAYKKAQERALIPNYKDLQFNEVIIHTLIPYCNNVSGNRNIDKQIAQTYKTDFARYYLAENKPQIKQVITEHLEMCKRQKIDIN